MPDAAPFTQARKELLTRLQGDIRFSDIAHWYEFSDGIKDRFDVQPSDCPYLALFPRATDEDLDMNAARTIPQGLTIEMGVAGQDVEPLERLEWDLLLFLRDPVRSDHLGLAGEGLTEIALTGGDWGLFPGQDSAAPKWVVSNELTLTWRVI